MQMTKEIRDNADCRIELDGSYGDISVVIHAKAANRHAGGKFIVMQSDDMRRAWKVPAEAFAVLNDPRGVTPIRAETGKFIQAEIALFKVEIEASEIEAAKELQALIGEGFAQVRREERFNDGWNSVSFYLGDTQIEESKVVNSGGGIFKTAIANAPEAQIESAEMKSIRSEISELRSQIEYHSEREETREEGICRNQISKLRAQLAELK